MKTHGGGKATHLEAVIPHLPLLEPILFVSEWPGLRMPDGMFDRGMTFRMPQGRPRKPVEAF